jgi:HAE1 family hydrophobic/amphiphilic exporter-1
MTMAGMTIAVGMVVDNAVVVLENIRACAPRAWICAARASRGREIGLAVTLATLTTVVVFLPLVFMGGARTRMMLGAGRHPSLGGAAREPRCGAAAPSRRHEDRGRDRGRARPRRRRSSAAPGPPVWWLERLNAVLLAWALRHRVLAIVLSLVVLGTTAVPWKLMDFSVDGGGPFKGGDLAVRMQVERGLTLADVEREVRGYEDFVTARKGQLGIEHVSTRFSRSSASVEIYLPPGATPDRKKEVKKQILAEWPRRPGLKVVIRDRGGSGGMEDEKEQRNFVVRLFGIDSEHLAELALTVRDEIKKLPEVESLDAGQLDRNQEVVVLVDRERINDLGVESQNLLGTVSAGLRGRDLGRFLEKGRELRLIAQFEGLEKASLKDLQETQVYGRSGAFQRVDELSTIRFRKTLGTIDRNDGRTSVTLLGRRAEGVGPLAFSAVLNKTMARVALPRGYDWIEDSSSKQTGAEIKELLQALGLSIVLVFLLMGVLFESVILPLACLATIPFGVFGALWSLWLLRGAIDVMSFVGLVLLAGVVVNNGIVLLDCVQRLRQEGMPRGEAILQATRRRLRPIVMTAATTIVGLLPTIVQGDFSQEGISYVTMSIIVAGGLLFCTVFTAFAVPLAYSVLDDIGQFGSAVWARASRRAAG